MNSLLGGIMSEVSFPERLSREEIRCRQDQAVKMMVREVGRTNPFWKQKLTGAGVDPDKFQGLADLTAIPLLTKQELVEDQNSHLPYGTNLTYPLGDFVRLHQTSGTTGRPMRWLDTRASWDWFMRCWDQLFRLAGLQPDDVLAFPFSFGPFIGFWAAFEGAQRAGNRTLAMGGMSSEARLKMIIDLEASVVCCTPTYAMRLADIAEQNGIPLHESAVRMLIVAGEPGGAIPAIRSRLETSFGARVIDHWGMTDIGALGMEPWDGPGGLLILETECIAEILNPETLVPVSPGELGELVITNLGRWGQPVIRYRTGDLVRASTLPCSSGTSLLRLEGGILGRSDDMVTIRGNNLFPSSLDAVIREFPQIAEYRITVVTRRAMPHVRIEIEPVQETAGCPEDRQALLTALGRAVKDRLSFQAEIESVPVGALPRFEMKGRRFHRETE